MNKVLLMGRLTKDPADFNGVVKFSLAVARRKKDETDFINCVAFGKTGENIRTFFHKGQRMAVCGRLSTGSYEKDGRRIYTTDVLVDEFDFIEKREEKPVDDFMPVDYEDEELPF